MNKLLHSAALAAAIGSAAPAMADSYVIVHGAFETAKSWEQVADHLQSLGHEVTLVDLPGRDADGDAAKAITQASYVEAVKTAVKAQSEPPILVGHSFGGITISLVGEALPSKVSELVYVAAYVPVDGESMESLAVGDKDNGFTQASFVVAPDYSYAEILEADRARLFVQDGDAETQKAVAAGMVREPLGPIGTPVALSSSFDAVPKSYIRTLNDVTVSTPLQTMMIERSGISDVWDIETGHMPHIVEPEQLSDLLDKIAG